MEAPHIISEKDEKIFHMQIKTFITIKACLSVSQIVT